MKTTRSIRQLGLWPVLFFSGLMGGVTTQALALDPNQAMQAIGVLGQLSGAINGQVTATGTANNPYGLDNSIPNYSSAQLQNMNCLDLELLQNRLNRDLQQRKQYATDLYEASKNAGTARQQQYGALASIIGGVIAQQGGRNAQYGQIAQQIGQNMSGTATSQQLDVEINRLQQLNSQIADVQTIRRYKNCGANGTTTQPTYSNGQTYPQTGYPQTTYPQTNYPQAGYPAATVFNPANYPAGSVIVTPSGQTILFPTPTRMRNAKGRLVTVYPDVNFPVGSNVRTPDGRLYPISVSANASAQVNASTSVRITNPSAYPASSVVVTPTGQRLALPRASKMRNASGRLVTVYEEMTYPTGSYVLTPAGKRYAIR